MLFTKIFLTPNALSLYGPSCSIEMRCTHMQSVVKSLQVHTLTLFKDSKASHILTFVERQAPKAHFDGLFDLYIVSSDGTDMHFRTNWDVFDRSAHVLF